MEPDTFETLDISLDAPALGSSSSPANRKNHHERIAQDEWWIGLFWAGLAIQYLLHKDMLQTEMDEPIFLEAFKDTELTASQRIFVKNILSNAKYKLILDKMRESFLMCCASFSSSKAKRHTPVQVFLENINKSFLIRQIFQHTPQVLPQYQFLETFCRQDIMQINMHELHQRIWAFPIEQQIIILSRIFASLGVNDHFPDKKKTLLQSFGENVHRTKEEMKRNRGRYSTREINNIVLFESFLGALMDWQP